MDNGYQPTQLALTISKKLPLHTVIDSLTLTISNPLRPLGLPDSSLVLSLPFACQNPPTFQWPQGQKTMHLHLTQCQIGYINSTNVIKITEQFHNNSFIVVSSISETKLQLVCTDNCLTCDNSGCNSCLTNYLLYQGLCYSTCPNGSYQEL